MHRTLGAVSYFPLSPQPHPSCSPFLYQPWLFPLVGSVELCEIPASLKTSLKKKKKIFLESFFSPVPHCLFLQIP